jgi:hypothetical protein
MKLTFTKFMSLLIGFTLFISACEGPQGEIGPAGQDGADGADGQNGQDGQDLTSLISLQNYSSTPALIKSLSGFESLQVYSLIGSDDKLIGSPGFTFGGSADGLGFLKYSNGYSIVVNHEDNFAVSRIQLDQSFRPVSGEYILNSDGGKWRLCSGTLATPEEHGFGPMYLTCGESNPESRTHALSPFASASQASMSRELPGLGRWNAENAVPLPKTAYTGKTVVLIGDDDSGAAGGQVAMYVSDLVGDLANGNLYVLRKKNATSAADARENSVVLGTVYDVEFAQIANHTTLTGAEINTASANLFSYAFNRVEDIDYRKDGVGREIYFNVTGANSNVADRTKYGRVYKLVLNPTNPLEGTLEVILDGDLRGATDKAREFQNPDNIIVTQNFAYIQEDPNSGYNDQTHDSYIYQYNLTTKELKKVLELDHRRTATDADKFNAVPGSGYPQPVAGRSGYGAWEYGAMVDISSQIGVPQTYLLCIQPHSWRGTAYRGVDGGTIRVNEDQASQIVIIKGLP